MLGLVHTLVWAHEITSMGRTYDFQTFTNNKTRFVWTSFLKEKFEALVQFKIQIFDNNNNGGEYVLKSFAQYCKMASIMN
jgi:hypothetical protein